ncbi:MAG: choice-of-anchor D domain-containing protein, partial [Deltaproteobacteria bacterium]|nr:choice-of-anchor D domain-containing protein [Deltaproteobacteria bacterium]
MNKPRIRIFKTFILLFAILGLAACGGNSASNDSGVTLCSSDDDCPLGWYCDDGICQQTSDGGQQCTLDSDCTAEEVCRDGYCVTETQDGGTDGGETDAGDQPATEADIEVEPLALDFGDVRIGQTATQQVTIRNVGGSDLTIFLLSMESGTSLEFDADPLGNLNEILGPGQELLIDVLYKPVDGTTDAGALLINSNDSDESLLRVELTSSYKGSSELTVVSGPADSEPEVELIDFGQVAVGGANQEIVYIKNTGTGNAVLTIAGVRTEPLSSINYAVVVFPELPAFLSPVEDPCLIDGDCPAENTCQAGVCIDAQGRVQGAVTAFISFTPLEVGVFQESLVITNDEQDGGADGDERIRIITLRGEGIQPALEVEPNPINFGSQFVGISESLNVTIRNAGLLDLGLTEISLVDGSGPFSLDLGGATEWNLEPGQATQISVGYTPSQAGAHQDSLHFVSNDPYSPLLVDLLGSASLPPEIEVLPQTIDFGETQLGETATAFFEVKNNGGSQLVVSRLELSLGSSSELVVIQQALQPIQPGASAQVDLRYSPAGVIGLDTGVVEIECNDPFEPFTPVDLTGLGTDPRLEAEPLAVNFGPIYQGYLAGPVIITIRNAGFGAMGITSLGFTAGSSSDFSLQAVPDPLPVLGQSESFQVELYFSPSGSGERLGAIAIGSTDRDTLMLEIAVSGIGSECPEGWWDANGNSADGCEYRCDLNNGGIEDCNNIDDNCDSDTDEGLTNRTCQRESIWGICTGAEYCDGANGWVGCDAQLPEEEICDDQDNDCDSATDAEDNSLHLEACSLQQGVCLGSVHRAVLCVDGFWQPCQAQDYGPFYGAEICDNRDNDCNDELDADDTGLLLAPCQNQQGACQDSTHRPSLCDTGIWIDCDATDYGVNPYYGLEECDSEDNDCDGNTDAGDLDLITTDCENQVGVCQGAVHRQSLCQNGEWQACETTDYENHSSDYYQTEICDGLDNNCGAGEDEGLTTRNCDNETIWGTCYGLETCDGFNGWIDCDAPEATEEICDSDDNDCDNFYDAADSSLALEPCELQDGVCAGAVHRSSLCVDGDWELCQAVDYGPSFGIEICGNALDEDCSGQANDKDVDGDTYLDPACGGDDCDDLDPLVNPGADEIQDAKDNDCNGLVDEGLIPAGAVIVTEIMKDPFVVDDSDGEWFEITNVWVNPINLHSFDVDDNGSNSFSINQPGGIVI